MAVSEVEGRVYLIEIYDKADYDTVDVAALKRMIAELGLL